MRQPGLEPSYYINNGPGLPLRAYIKVWKVCYVCWVI